jgi:deoxycytidylate deaminase
VRKFPVNSSVTVCRKVHEEGRAIAQAVSRRALTAEAWVHARVSPCGICGEKIGTGTGFSSNCVT